MVGDGGGFMSGLGLWVGSCAGYLVVIRGDVYVTAVRYISVALFNATCIVWGCHRLHTPYMPMFLSSLL